MLIEETYWPLGQPSIGIDGWRGNHRSSSIAFEIVNSGVVRNNQTVADRKSYTIQEVVAMGFDDLIPYYLHPRQDGTRTVRSDGPLWRSPVTHCDSVPSIAMFFRLNH